MGREERKETYREFPFSENVLREEQNNIAEETQAWRNTDCYSPSTDNRYGVEVASMRGPKHCVSRAPGGGSPLPRCN